MTTSNGPAADTLPPEAPRGPLRLRISAQPGRDRLDGGWWPHSRDLTRELAELAEHFPPALGGLVRALCWPPDWDDPPRAVVLAGDGRLEIGSLRRDESHLVLLTTSRRAVLRVLVVPPDFSEDQGSEALLAAATPGNSHSAESLLETVTEHPDVDPYDHWTDDGGSWWGPDPTAPSFRMAAGPGTGGT